MKMCSLCHLVRVMALNLVLSLVKSWLICFKKANLLNFIRRISFYGLCAFIKELTFSDILSAFAFVLYIFLLFALDYGGII